MQRVELQGITKQDIQDIFENVIKQHKVLPKIIYLDVNYLYNFHLDDFEIVKRFNKLGRYDIKAVLEWHRSLERWLQDQTVILGDKSIKPIQISRALDRVTNEGLLAQAASIVGSGDISSMEFRMIGKGVFGSVTPGDVILAAEIDRINVNETAEGGSLSRDGTTVYSIGNHAKTVETADVTECGMADTDDATTDLLFDHSKFETAISHTQNADAVGSTTVVYLCSA